MGRRGEGEWDELEREEGMQTLKKEGERAQREEKSINQKRQTEGKIETGIYN